MFSYSIALIVIFVVNENKKDQIAHIIMKAIKNGPGIDIPELTVKIDTRSVLGKVQNAKVYAHEISKK